MPKIDSTIFERVPWKWIAIVWSILIAIGSLLPKSNIPEVTFIWSPDKLVHIVMYGTLAFLVVTSIRPPKISLKSQRLRNISFVFALKVGFVCLAYSILIEILQPIITDRNFELLDIVANATGITLALLLTSKIWSALHI